MIPELPGLSAWYNERRTREIGIRNVFGAGAIQIMFALFQSIFFVVCIGSVIAAVMSWYLINAWFQNFACQDEVNWLRFLTALLNSCY